MKHPSASTTAKSGLARVLLFGLFAFALAGCAGHSKKTLAARAALDRGDAAAARRLLNRELQVKGAAELPNKKKKNAPVLVLDRSMVSQQLAEYEASSRDLEYADKQVELLDMSRTALDDIGKYTFSDSAGRYKGAPHEKVMINTMNIVNYLARHDLGGARVEARRLSILQKYLADTKHPAKESTAPGGYLAGFVFEQSGEANEALRYYDEALAHASLPDLAPAVARLLEQGTYSTPRLVDLARGAGTRAESTAAAEDQGELLVVVNYGRVPAKIPRRIPIGLALTYGTLYLSPRATASANRLAAQGLVTWINYPELEESRRALAPATAQLDGRPLQLTTAAALDQIARDAYDKDRGKIVAAAVTRMITRLVAGESAGAVAKKASGEGVVGALISLGAQAALSGADTPDTRSWSTLPARIDVARTSLPAGEHTVELRAQGATRTARVTIEPGGWQAVVLTVLR